MHKHIAVTGASGLLGGLLLRGLAGSYTVRAIDRRPLTFAEGETRILDVQNLDALQEAFQGIESVIHMAGNSSPWATWEEALPDNIVGTYTLLEAAARAGVQQVILASSNHAVGGYELEEAPNMYRTGQPLLDHNTPIRPDSIYGVSKCVGEALGRYYADYRGLRVICLRIGHVNRADNPYPASDNEDSERLTAMWLSQRDFLQLVEKCIQADNAHFEILYGISNIQPHFYDIEQARIAVGYIPADSAEVSKAQPKNSIFNR